MKIRSLLKLVFGALCVCLLIISCTASAPPQSSESPSSQSAASGSPSPSAAAIVGTVKMGFNNWPGYMPWKVAEVEGLFEKHNLKADITWFSQLSDMLNAYNTGNVDTTGLTTGDLITAAVKGVKSKVILMMDYSNGGDGILATDDVKSVADFKGKTVYVEKGTVGEHMLLLALQKNGLKAEDIKIINMPADTAGAAFAAGKADIVVTYEPFMSKGIASRGNGKIIFSTKDLPGLIPDLMTLRQEVVDKNPAIAQAMVDTWFDALKYQQEHPDEALAIEAKQAGVSPEEFQKDRDVLKFLTPKEAALAFDPNDKTVSLFYNGAGIAEFLQKEKIIDQAPPSIDTLIDDRFLKTYLTQNPA